MSIETMKQALEALQNSKPLNADGMLNAEAMNELWHAHYAAIDALRTAIKQAEAKTGEPVKVCGLPSGMATSQNDGKWRVLLEFDTESDAKALQAYMTDNDVPAKSMTHPAPGVPDDVRIAGQALANIAFNLAQNTGSKIEKRWADSMREAYKAWDAAMLAAAQAQKGGE